MFKNAFKLWVALAWGGVAISSASPASALYASPDAYSEYASCPAAWMYMSEPTEVCGNIFMYGQAIRFVGQACGAGGCQSDGSGIVDSLYSPGRKIATDYGGCETMWGLMGIYGLGSCAC
jgi:hypothetical protein